MTARSCCGRGAEIAGWMVPGATLALLPKCPMCVAGYIAVATGLGVSISAASYIRASILIVAASTLVFVAARRGLRWSRRKSNHQHAECSAC